MGARPQSAGESGDCSARLRPRLPQCTCLGKGLGVLPWVTPPPAPRVLGSANAPSPDASAGTSGKHLSWPPWLKVRPALLSPRISVSWEPGSLRLCTPSAAAPQAPALSLQLLCCPVSLDALPGSPSQATDTRPDPRTRRAQSTAAERTTRWFQEVLQEPVATVGAAGTCLVIPTGNPPPPERPPCPSLLSHSPRACPTPSRSRKGRRRRREAASAFPLSAEGPTKKPGASDGNGSFLEMLPPTEQGSHVCHFQGLPALFWTPG